MENEKCPCCQAEMFYIHNSRAYQCGACPFRCHISYMPRIAAAMDLARARSAYAQAPSSLGDEETQELWGDVTTTTKRVLEVFGGE